MTARTRTRTHIVRHDDGVTEQTRVHVVIYVTTINSIKGHGSVRYLLVWRQRRKIAFAKGRQVIMEGKDGVVGY